jgi:hypothetical protein
VKVEKESKLHFILAFVWRHVVVLCMRETLHDPVQDPLHRVVNETENAGGRTKVRGIKSASSFYTAFYHVHGISGCQ